MRKWVLDVGFWSARTVAFAVSLWSPSSSLSEQALTSAPVWLSLQGVPPQLRSNDGLAIIASGVGAPIPPSDEAKPPSFGSSSQRIRAVVRLDNGPLPSTVIVKDDEGCQVVIGVQYISLPSLCPSCSSYGHRSHRCPLGPQVPSPPESSNPPSQSDNPISLPVTSPQPPVIVQSPHGGHIVPTREDDPLGFASSHGPNLAKPISQKLAIAFVPSPPSLIGPFNNLPKTFKPMEFQNISKSSSIPSSHIVNQAESIQKAQSITQKNQDPNNLTLLPDSPPSSSTFTSLLLLQIEFTQASPNLLLTKDSLLESILIEHHRTQIKQQQPSFSKKNNDKYG